MMNFKKILMFVFVTNLGLSFLAKPMEQDSGLSSQGDIESCCNVFVHLLNSDAGKDIFRLLSNSVPNLFDNNDIRFRWIVRRKENKLHGFKFISILDSIDVNHVGSFLESAKKDLVESLACFLRWSFIIEAKEFKEILIYLGNNVKNFDSAVDIERQLFANQRCDIDLTQSILQFKRDMQTLLLVLIYLTKKPPLKGFVDNAFEMINQSGGEESKTVPIRRSLVKEIERALGSL